VRVVLSFGPVVRDGWGSGAAFLARAPIGGLVDAGSHRCTSCRPEDPDILGFHRSAGIGGHGTGTVAIRRGRSNAAGDA